MSRMNDLCTIPSVYTQNILFSSMMTKQASTFQYHLTVYVSKLSHCKKAIIEVVNLNYDSCKQVLQSFLKLKCNAFPTFYNNIQFTLHIRYDTTFNTCVDILCAAFFHFDFEPSGSEISLLNIKECSDELRMKLFSSCCLECVRNMNFMILFCYTLLK